MIINPYNIFEPVTPNDGADLAEPPDALYVVGDGTQDLVVHDMNGNARTFTDVPKGVLPLKVKRVLATGTTVTSVVALYIK